MSLIVETGTASADSEAYATVYQADVYHAAMGNSLWATLLNAEKEQALRRAATFMCQSYRMSWKGSRVNSTQALDWPRYNVEIPDLGVPNTVLPDIVPIPVRNANVELALLAAAGNLNPVEKQSVLSKQVGPIKIVYDVGSPQTIRYSAVNQMLSPYMTASSAGMNVKLRRV